MKGVSFVFLFQLDKSAKRRVLEFLQEVDEKDKLLILYYARMPGEVYRQTRGQCGFRVHEVSREAWKMRLLKC